MTCDHVRNTGPMLASLRCDAKTRSGNPCRSPAVREKKALPYAWRGGGIRGSTRQQERREAWALHARGHSPEEAGW
jgi:hypothetical protein